MKITDASGNIVWQADYEPFGKAVFRGAIQIQIVNNFRLPGQYEDLETGLYYNMNRYYWPDTGRYITPDPYLTSFPLLEGITPYEYASLNPIRFIDPTGEQVIPDEACAIAYARDASNLERQLGLSDAGRDHGPSNAFLHCVWSCLMMEKCGRFTAYTAGHRNEFRFYNIGISRHQAVRMDLHNNREGRDCVGELTCGLRCEDCCLEKLITRQLTTTDPPNGIPYD